MKQKRKFSILIVLFLLIGLAIFFLSKESSSNISINSYEECVKANDGQVNLMYPPQCTTKDGRTFIDPSAKPVQLP